jgi:hypothetical protein
MLAHDRSMSKNCVFQTLLALVMFCFGLLLLIFNQRLAKSAIGLTKWTFGIGELVPGSCHATFVLVGLFCVIYGSLCALRLRVGPRYCIS